MHETPGIRHFRFFVSTEIRQWDKKGSLRLRHSFDAYLMVIPGEGGAGFTLLLHNCWAISWALRLISAGAYPGFCSIKKATKSIFPLLVHRRLPPQLWLVPIYSWVKRSNRSKATCPGLQTNMPVMVIEPMILGLWVQDLNHLTTLSL